MKPPLRIDEDAFREWLMLYFDRMQEMETETLVYRSTVEFLLTKVPPETRQTIEKIVERSRGIPEIKGEVEKKYTEYRAQALEAISKGSLDQALSRYLRGWKAKGPIN